MSPRPLHGLLTAGLFLALVPATALAQSPQPALDGTWHLVRIAGSGVPFIEVPASLDPTLVIAGSDASGFAGCNQWFSSVVVEGDTIAFGPIGNTLMACPEPGQGFEIAYLGALPSVSGWTLADGELQLSDANGSVLLVFRAGAASALEGTDWLLTGVPMAGQLADVPGDVVATLRLDGGQAGGSTGCNSFSGGYTLEGASLAFGPPMRTEMACPEPQMQVESAYMAALDMVASWRIDGSTLSLLDSAGAVVLTFTPAPAGTIAGAWQATGIAYTGTFSSLLPDTTLTATFGMDGTLSGSAGCNAYSGPYLVEGSALKVGPLISSRMTCPPQAVMVQETTYLAALEASVAWSVGPGGALELRDAAGQTTVSFIRPAG